MVATTDLAFPHQSSDVVLTVFQTLRHSLIREELCSRCLTDNRLGSLPRNSVVRLTDRLDMTIVVDWDVKPQIKQMKDLNC